MNHKEFMDCLEEEQRALDKDAARESQIDDLREHVRILRDVCRAALSALESHQAYDKDMRPELRAALEQTK